MTSNEERLARLEGISEGVHRELTDIHAEIRSTRNTLLIVNLLLWVSTIGTMVGFFVTIG